MIYCVVPPELEQEIYEKLRAYYEGNPNVEVIIDRRSGPNRRAERSGAEDERRETRDRRRARAPGTFPSTDVEDP